MRISPIANQSLLIVILSVSAILVSCSQKESDPRLVVFEKFNRAATYEDAKPLLSGILASQLSGLNSRNAADVTKVLNSLKLTSYTPRIVDVNATTSFLVLENAQSSTGRKPTQTYLLTRDAAGVWTLENRVAKDSVVKSLWTSSYAPTEFAQPSTCAVSGKEIAGSGNEKSWDMKSAVAFREKNKIEITLLPFEITAAELNSWKYLGMAVDSRVLQESALDKPHPACRIILVPDESNHITSANVGFDDPVNRNSTLWQLTKRPAALPQGISSFEVGNNRIKLETAGTLTAGDTIRWKTKLDLPLLEKGL